MPYRLAVLTTLMNPPTIQAMLTAAAKNADRLDADLTMIVATVGCLDMPVIADYLLRKKNIDGLVVLGAVAQGDTDHDEVVVETMTLTIVQLSVKLRKPVGFGVIGPGAKPQQFAARTNSYAQRAVAAVVTNLNILRGR